MEQKNKRMAKKKQVQHIPVSEEKRETVGKAAYDLLLKENKPTHTPIDQMREQLEHYEENIFICLERSKKDFPDDDFYIVVLVKRERLLPNVFRRYFFGRLTCPTPNYDQVVYKYHKKDDRIEFLWVIPDRETCKEFMYYSQTGDPPPKELLSYVVRFKDGSLFTLAKKLNGELGD